MQSQSWYRRSLQAEKAKLLMHPMFSFCWDRVLRSMMLGGLVVLTLMTTKPSAWANVRNDLTAIQQQLNKTTTNIEFLGKSLQNIKVSGRVSLNRRLADGQINFLLKDYLRASIILLDAVENPANKGKRAWYDAVYFLAESLYYNRNIKGSVKYYRLLVQEGRQHMQKGLVRLMEIAAKSRKQSWLNQYFQRAQGFPAGPLRNKIYYLRGKGLYQLGRRSQAKSMFEQITSTPAYGPRAKYFLAVLLLEENLKKPDLARAIQLLKSALSKTPDNKAEAKLRDTILISLGRLHMEQKKIGEALLYYRQISRNSHLFDQSLYEICWAYIRRGNALKSKTKKQKEYKRALQALDLLLAFLPSSPFYPRAQLLKGNLQLQLAPFKKGKEQELLFTSAMNNYNRIANRYRRVYKEMEQITQNRARPLTLFEQLVEQQLDKFNVAKILPQDAIRWMSDEELMSRTLVMLKDLREMQSELNSARLIIKRLESALTVGDRYSLSPTLRDARLRCSNQKSTLTELQQRLVELKEQLSLSRLSSSERQEYDAIRKRLKTLRYLFLRTPRTSKDLLKRSSQVQERITAMINRLHKITILLDYSVRKHRALRRWLETSEEARKLTPSQRSSLESDANQFGRMITNLQQEKARLTNELEVARIKYGYAAAGPQEERIQTRYNRELQKEQLFFNRIKSRLSGDDQRVMDEIQRTSNQAHLQQKRVKGFFVLLTRLSEAFAQRVRQQISTEKLKLDRYDQQIFQLRLQSKKLASRIAFNTFLTVRGKFRELVLQAEVGVIDVAWREKQTIQNEKIRLSKERNSELRVLDSEFRDLVQEVK